MIPTLEQVMGDNLSAIHFWNTSIDMLIPSKSHLSYKGQGRHLTLSKTHLQGIVLHSCPRCNSDWEHYHNDNGKVRCSTRGCNTFKEHPFPTNTNQYQPMPYADIAKPIEEFVANNGRANSWSHPSNLPSSLTIPREEDTLLHDMVANNGRAKKAKHIHPSVNPEDEMYVLLGLYKEKNFHPLSPAPPNVNIPLTTGANMNKTRGIEVSDELQEDVPTQYELQEDISPQDTTNKTGETNE